VKTRIPLPFILIGLAACHQDQPTITVVEPSVNDGVFVQLFEWKWPDVAVECEQQLGPAGYAAVQISPPQEHIPGNAWWTRYQPVSYRLESRGGTREEFAEMVARCQAAGVGIYADAVINHMADIGSGVGVAGSEYTKFNYPVPYGYDDFHHCGRNEDGRIANYQDKWEVQNCQLGLLADIDTSKPSVQDKIAAYLDDLHGLGVAGLRIDAAKHMAADDIAAILGRAQGFPFVFQEVIDRGGEPITGEEYIGNGHVTEFRFASALIEAFKRGNVKALDQIGGDQWLSPGDAVVFIDNHDSQRAHLGDNILNYKDPVAYDLATVFMLAFPYGYPVLMSSYAFDEDDDPVPESSPQDQGKGCGEEWVCEHRRPLATTMVAFRKAMADLPVGHWHASGDIVSFSRGDRGHVVINVGNEPVKTTLSTGINDGRYTDRLAGNATAIVDSGNFGITIAPRTALVFVAD
jgi:alpha-amylase